MFNLLSVFKTQAAVATPMQNTLNEYSVLMPEGLIPALQGRLFSVIMHRLYGLKNPHQCTTEAMIVLHDRLSREPDARSHNFVLDGYELHNLRCFLRVDRALTLSERQTMTRRLTNTEYWNLTGELLESLQHPTHINKLSFFA